MLRVILAASIVSIATVSALAQGKAAPSDQELKAVVDKGYRWLKTAQNADGSFAPRRAGPGISALVAVALLRSGYTADDPVVAKTLAYLANNVQKDGGIYNRFLANYTTSVALMAFREANTRGKYDGIIKNAVAFLKRNQHREPETSADDPKYGGFGYDRGGRPDLSNTIFAVDALVSAGIAKDDPALKRAVAFLSRCQNLPSEDNKLPFAKKATPDDRGGFTYTPFYSKKNPYATPAGGLRSLGGMTYGGLKSMLYAGVDRNDPRVKAAVDWIRRHYTLKENPGMGQAGLYYYFHTFAKAMDAWGEDPFVDAKGNKHYWRRELFDRLASLQRSDGSWANPNRAFGESTPELATAFAVLSLSYCRSGSPD